MAAIHNCDRLGRYRMPFAWTAINLSEVLKDQSPSVGGGGGGSATISSHESTEGGSLGAELRPRSASQEPGKKKGEVLRAGSTTTIVISCRKKNEFHSSHKRQLGRRSQASEHGHRQQQPRSRGKRRLEPRSFPLQSRHADSEQFLQARRRKAQRRGPLQVSSRSEETDVGAQTTQMHGR